MEEINKEIIGKKCKVKLSAFDSILGEGTIWEIVGVKDMANNGKWLYKVKPLNSEMLFDFFENDLELIND